jgi:hypothetical protein
MREIARTDLLRRIQAENPWWVSGHVGAPLEGLRPRAYFGLFLPLVKALEIRRAVVLMGPRRVGKTVLIHQAIDALLGEGVAPRQIAYLSVDHPLYTGQGLEDLLDLYFDAARPESGQPIYVFFDEIQYLRDWEVHLKVLVDEHPTMKAVASGSAAAALSLKSRESGAGRFTDFLLPPLTFYEYLDLVGELDLVAEEPSIGSSRFFKATDIDGLNRRFIHYLNFGGYPEILFTPAAQADPGRFIKSDIIDKVLLRDLPSLYGISDIQELNRLFTSLAFNTAGEVSLQDLASDSGVAKNTLKRYTTYLEAAFLIRVVHRVDESARHFKRARNFKVYLTNPSMRAALFSPVDDNSAEVGALAETAIFSQWFHSDELNLYYARWKDGEVDIVRLGADQRVKWAVEVKWSDRYAEKPRELKSLVNFCRKNGLSRGWATSRTVRTDLDVDDIRLSIIPTSVYCFTLGHNIIHEKKERGPHRPPDSGLIPSGSARRPHP